MNFYPFHIGDYAAHTRNLSLMEDLAYRRLLDAYYLSEQPFSGSPTDVAREIGMRDQVPEVEYILAKFFERDGDLWRNKRADAEIDKYRAKSEQASRAGKVSAQRRLDARSTPVENNPSDVQPTKNQEPRTRTIETLNPLVSKADAVPVEQVVMAYNETLGDVLAKAQRLTDARRKHIRARWNEMLGTTDAKGNVRFLDADSGVQWFARFFRKVTTNPHWLGGNDRGWRADLDWIMNPTNFTKILEYVPIEARTPTNSGYDRRGQERVDVIAGLTGRSTSQYGGNHERTIDGEAERLD